jgi:nitrate reductase delta subunit
MPASAELLDSLATVLEYPNADFANRADACVACAQRERPDVAADLAQFASFARSSELGEAEERYVATFDANAERALEVGWQVFGEQYARGAFLVELRGQMRECGVAEGTELPDHLTQVLRLLGRIDAARARTLVDNAVAPALRRVMESLAKQPDNPYAGVLHGIRGALGIPAAPACSSRADEGGAR